MRWWIWMRMIQIIRLQWIFECDAEHKSLFHMLFTITQWRSNYYRRNIVALFNCWMAADYDFRILLTTTTTSRPKLLGGITRKGKRGEMQRLLRSCMCNSCGTCFRTTFAAACNWIIIHRLAEKTTTTTSTTELSERWGIPLYLGSILALKRNWLCWEISSSSFGLVLLYRHLTCSLTARVNYKLKDVI